MTEPAQTYQANTNGEIIVNKSFTIMLKHVGMINQMVGMNIDKNDSAIVRQAIELLYDLVMKEMNDAVSVQ